MVLTPAEFDAIDNYDERFRYELIHGVVVVSPIESERSADPNEELGYWLRQYQHTHAQGKALDKTLAQRYVRLAKSRRLADRVLWCGLGRLPDPDKDVPSVAVEFVSRRKRDRVRDYEEKRRDYPAAGVKEYWIVDPFQRIMTVVRKQRGKVTLRVIQEDEIYRTDLLPGFELPLAALLALADQWEKRRRS